MSGSDPAAAPRGPDRAAPAMIARLRVAIDDVAPAVVRRLEVPLDIRLDDLHFVLQIAIGWQNCHPFEFRSAAGGPTWGLVDRDDPDSTTQPAERATLAELYALGRRFHYDYVYGEDWSHTIDIEAAEPAAASTIYPRLLSAEGRCPPADIGGVTGYETYLLAISDPKHLQHEARLGRSGLRSPDRRRGGAARQPRQSR